MAQHLQKCSQVSLVVNNRVIFKWGRFQKESGPTWYRYVLVLFLSQEYMHRTSEEVEMSAKLVLQETTVRFADILRKVAEERE